MISNILLSQAYKGKGKVKGIVTDQEGKPLEGVRVKLFSLKAQSGFETVTDANGEWKAFWIRGGNWYIDFEKQGYIPKKLNADIDEYKKNRIITVTMQKMEGLVLTDELKEELDKGNRLFEEENYIDAIKVYQEILNKYPDIYQINKNIGNCYFRLEDFEKAEEYYMKVFEKDSEDNEAILLIGNSYSNRGDNEKAIEWYNKIEFEKMKDPTVLYNIGSNFYSNSKYEKAVKYYRRAAEIQEDFLDAIYQLGLAYLALGQHEDSIETFKKYLVHDSDSERANQVKGFIEFLKDKI